MIGVPWTQHVAFLGDRALVREHPASRRPRPFAPWPRTPRRCCSRSATRFRRRSSAGTARPASNASCGISMTRASRRRPSSLITYVNFPPTEYLDLDCFDVHSFNVYLHREADLRAYLARLQHAAGNRPFLLAEAGADSIREGLDGQARHHRDARPRGVRGRRGRRGGVCLDRRVVARRPHGGRLGVRPGGRGAPAQAGAGRRVARVRRGAVPAATQQAAWPKVSVVVCAYNAADTIDDCLTSLSALTYPNAEIIVVNDGSRDRDGRRSRAAIRRPQVIDVPNGGLSAARNIGMRARDRRDRGLHRCRRAGRSRLAHLSRAADSVGQVRRLGRAQRRARPTTTGWRSAWRGRRAARRTCC